MKLVLLDRDGVVNVDSEHYIKSPAEWTLLPGSGEAIGQLCAAGYRISLITNQSGIARGLFSEHDLMAIHAAMQQSLAAFGGGIEAIFYCPHGPDDDCQCRKPRTGLLEQAAQYFKHDLHGIPFVGDSLRDLHCAMRFGCQPTLVLTGNGQRTQHELPAQHQVAIFDDLQAAAQQLLTTS